MITYNKETPVLLAALGTVETIQQIYSELQQIEPQRLYLVFDAPKTKEHTASQEQIQSIFTGLKWKCKVKTLYNKTHSEYNATMLKAARWLFSNEPEGILLDGRNVPFPAFFAFCSSLLEKYRYDERIGHISGWDFQKHDRKPKTQDSYYFSKLVHISQGWASWRRVWKNMNIQLKTFRSFKKLNIIEDIPTHKPFRYL